MEMGVSPVSDRVLLQPAIPHPEHGEELRAVCVMGRFDSGTTEGRKMNAQETKATDESGATKFRTVTVVLTDNLAQRLDAEASRQTMSRSLLIRQMCEQGLKAGSGDK